MKNGQTYFKNFAVGKPLDFYSMLIHFSTLCMERFISSLSLDLYLQRFYKHNPCIANINSNKHPQVFMILLMLKRLAGTK